MMAAVGGAWRIGDGLAMTRHSAREGKHGAVRAFIRHSYSLFATYLVT